MTSSFAGPAQDRSRLPPTAPLPPGGTTAQSRRTPPSQAGASGSPAFSRSQRLVTPLPGASALRPWGPAPHGAAPGPSPPWAPPQATSPPLRPLRVLGPSPSLSSQGPSPTGAARRLRCSGSIRSCAPSVRGSRPRRPLLARLGGFLRLSRLLRRTGPQAAQGHPDSPLRGRTEDPLAPPPSGTTEKASPAPAPAPGGLGSPAVHGGSPVSAGRADGASGSPPGLLRQPRAASASWGPLRLQARPPLAGRASRDAHARPALSSAQVRGRRGLRGREGPRRVPPPSGSWRRLHGPAREGSGFTGRRSWGSRGWRGPFAFSPTTSWAPGPCGGSWPPRNPDSRGSRDERSEGRPGAEGPGARGRGSRAEGPAGPQRPGDLDSPGSLRRSRILSSAPGRCASALALAFAAPGASPPGGGDAALLLRPGAQVCAPPPPPPRASRARGPGAAAEAPAPEPQRLPGRQRPPLWP
ncbi:collagen alpha-1(I) chain-like [Talpa occidentalis]|uniref:collagen alpha-1(I) chain-like n=1 Tax=Talpa occidentalis TaxID=50954 RepID=UPI0018908679|nr:collagen alpha-1(I) chain-like [Talpa occidentalis]